MEACLPRRRGTKGRGLDAAEPETRARAIATPVDVAPLDVVARRREATASGRAAAVIDAVVAIVAIVAAVSSDEGARCFARPGAAKAKAPSTPLARDVVFPTGQRHPDRSMIATAGSSWPKMPKSKDLFGRQSARNPTFLSSLGVTERHSDAHATRATPARGAADAASRAGSCTIRARHTFRRARRPERDPPCREALENRPARGPPFFARADVASQRCPLKIL